MIPFRFRHCSEIIGVMLINLVVYMFIMSPQSYAQIKESDTYIDKKENESQEHPVENNESNLSNPCLAIIKAMPEELFKVTLYNGNEYTGNLEVNENDQMIIKIRGGRRQKGRQNDMNTQLVFFEEIKDIQLVVKSKNHWKGYLVTGGLVATIVFFLSRVNK